jgi:predicted nicotinamide N-methyase
VNTANWVQQVVPLDGHDVVIELPPDPFAEEIMDVDLVESDEELAYWAELWPSALALARALSGRALGSRRVLELGCGLALPSIVAALAGARVLATDFSGDALLSAQHNAALNGVQIDTLLLDWREPQPILDRGPWDLVIGADVLYEDYHVPVLVDLMAQIGAPVLLGDQGRRAAEPFIALAQEHFDVVSRVDRDLSHVVVHSLTPH